MNRLSGSFPRRARPDHFAGCGNSAPRTIASARLDPGTARAPDHGRAVCLPVRQPELVPAGGLWPRTALRLPELLSFGATGPVYGRYSWDYNVYFAAGLGWYQEYLPHFPYPMYQPASYYLQYPTSSYNHAWKGLGGERGDLH